MINTVNVQQTLFAGQEGFEVAQKAFEELNKGKRGFYNKDYTKPKHTDNEYNRAKLLYKQLANFLDIPYFYNSDAVYYFSQKRIKAWCYQYTEEDYEYEHKLYKGEEFKTREAEIVGTENLDISTRIRLHQKLIEYLEDNIKLDEAVDMIQNELKLIKERYKLGDFALWLKKHRG